MTPLSFGGQRHQAGRPGPGRGPAAGAQRAAGGGAGGSWWPRGPRAGGARIALARWREGRRQPEPHGAGSGAAGGGRARGAAPPRPPPEPWAQAAQRSAAAAAAAGGAGRAGGRWRRRRRRAAAALQLATRSGLRRRAGERASASSQAPGWTTPATRAPWRYRVHPGAAQAPRPELQDGRQAEQEEEGVQCE